MIKVRERIAQTESGREEGLIYAQTRLIGIDAAKTMAVRTRSVKRAAEMIGLSIVEFNQTFVGDFGAEVREQNRDVFGQPFYFDLELDRMTSMQERTAAALFLGHRRVDLLKYSEERLFGDFFQIRGLEHPMGPLLGMEYTQYHFQRTGIWNHDLAYKSFRRLKQNEKDNLPRVAAVAARAVAWGEKAKDYDLAEEALSVYEEVVKRRPSTEGYLKNERKKARWSRYRDLWIGISAIIAVGKETKTEILENLKVRE